jgi:acyl-CoA thioesterase
MKELDRDTALRPIGEGRFEVDVSDRWGIYGIPNGGYLMALATRALAEVLPHPDPFTLTAHFLSPAQAGPSVIETDVLRAGRGHSTGVARLVQDGKERVRLTAIFGDLSRADGPTVEVGERPLIPALDACAERTGAPPGSTFADRMRLRFAPGTVSFLGDPPTDDLRLGGWMRLADEREPDVLSLPLFSDAMPPPVLNVVPRVWVPTLELTVHVRRRPAPGWIAGWFSTRFLIDGYLEEDGELWDAEGRLVALSRQLARVQRP